ncbi:hypothetical protein KFX89_05645 [Bacteroides thetaiotaomicron]|uniref:hypothetical protein n=1 Tax=Bacteroides thetaiotaomicron TaxID=818 RepID=UPI001CE2A662|nr:hypothetical protein [Bacteroides thetaiotaomicron]MCA6026244.1 hypothetical protein [Bacteroides thetaiotaomicron]
MKINTHILGLLVVVGLFSLQSCDDESYDIEGSNQNYVYIIQSPNQKIPDRKTKCVIKTHINIKQNVIFGAKLKPV